MEDFAPIFHYIKGPHNIIADALSRLPHKVPTLVGKSSSEEPKNENNFCNCCVCREYGPNSNLGSCDCHTWYASYNPYCFAFDEELLGDFVIHHPLVDPSCSMPLDDCFPVLEFPLYFPTLRDAQMEEQELVQMAAQNDRFELKGIAGNEVLMYKHSQNHDWKICLPPP